MVGGIGINTAHELGHKKEQHERWLAKIALAQSCYGHFFIEHNRGHHVRVATPEDPASSRLGECSTPSCRAPSLGSLRSAWSLEKPRLERLRQVALVDPQRRPQRLGDVAGALRRAGRRLRLVGPAVPAVQAVVGFSPAGGRQLPRALRPAAPRTGADGTGRYERVLPEHSWNSNNVATNVLLYHLQRHSDHHANPTRRYQTLRHFEEAPELPTGYAGMIVLALVPPLWRRVMDPRVLAHFDGDLSRANLQPASATGSWPAHPLHPLPAEKPGTSPGRRRRLQRGRVDLRAAVLGPGGVEGALAVGAPVGVRAEEVPLPLDQGGRQPLGRSAS